jgi:hypothetical protein
MSEMLRGCARLLFQSGNARIAAAGGARRTAAHGSTDARDPPVLNLGVGDRPPPPSPACCRSPPPRLERYFSG